METKGTKRMMIEQVRNGYEVHFGATCEERAVAFCVGDVKALVDEVFGSPEPAVEVDDGTP